MNSQAAWHRLSETVSGLMKKHAIPGVAVGILHEGVMQTAGFGITNMDHPLPVTEETLFQIGSITKTFTGTLVMRLVEAGKIDLNARIRTYIPDFRVADEETSHHATVHHLLTHMGGWEGDVFHDTGQGDDALSRYVADMGRVEQLAPLGAVWSYNNSGFTVLGRIIELVTGQPYPVALQERLLTPLGLKDAFFAAGDVMVRRFAVGHHEGEEALHVAQPWPLGRYAWPMGGIVCHVKDLLHYAHFHMGDGNAADGKRVLQEQSVHQMQSPQASRWGSREQVGLTWFIDDVDGVQQISHSGGTVGQISLLSLIPAHNFALAVLTNANMGGQVTEAVRRWVLQEYLRLTIPKPALAEASEVDPAQYVGRYSRPFAEIELGILAGNLVGQIVNKQGFPNENVPPSPAPPPFRLAFLKSNENPPLSERLLILDGPLKDSKVDIIRKPDGAVGWLRLRSRIHARVAD